MKGFRNNGNLCYMNVIFQMLFQLEDVMDYLAKFLPDSALPVTAALLEVHSSYTRPSGNIVSVIPKELYFFAPHHQNDAHEYLILLLDRIDEELKKKGESSNEKFFNHHQLSRFINQHDPLDITHITMKENILLLPFTRSLEESFRRLHTTDLLHDWESEKHGRALFPATRTNSISAWPAHLFILVHRYNLGPEKTNTTMDFPHSFRDYHFRGCVNHFGDMTRGHYMCIIQRGDQAFLCNDECLSSCPKDRLQGFIKNAYLLLYSRTDC